MNRKMWWSKRSSWPHLAARWLMLFATGGYILLPSSLVWANPAGEQVVGGAATFNRQGKTLTINQTTDRLAVNWKDFSIAAGEKTHFNMPSSSSAALNRVLGGNPSQIYGTLSANGSIYLVNPSGIFVGPGGVVNAASFVGSTLDIDPTQFMQAGAGKGMSLQGNSYAPIVNQGDIKAEKGDVFLIAQKVENRGTISAPNGKAALVGVGTPEERTEVVLHEVGGSGFAVRLAQLEGSDAVGSNHNLPDGEELLNEGEIAAAQAELNASGNIYALAIRNTGTIRAKAVVANADGTVRLDGGRGDVRNAGTLIAKNAGEEAMAAGGKIEVTGQNVTASPESIITAAGGVLGGDGGRVKIDSADTTVVQGKVDVSAPAAQAKGGKAELLGIRVGLFDGAKVDASGGAGGGTVLAGGDYLGGQTPKPEYKELARQEAEPVKNAKATVMAETAEIKADATVNGDGGKVILWSDEYTAFYGNLFARGGGEGGNGGFIETSSKNNLQVGGVGWASASKGTRGLWLLDPINVNISSVNPSSGGSFDGGTWFPSNLNSSVFVGDIITALQSTDVTITTAGNATDNNGGILDQNGDITVGANINIITAGSGNLRLAADGSITVGNPISIVGNVTLNAGSGSVSLVSGIQTFTGDISITAATSVTGGGLLTASVGRVSVNSGSQNINLSGGITAGATTQTGISLSSGAAQVIANSQLSTQADISLYGATGVVVNSVLSGADIRMNSANGGDISVNSAVTAAGNLNINAGTDDATTSISFGGGANVDAFTINLNARNNVNFGGGATVTMTDPDSNSVFTIRAVNGSMTGGGTVAAQSGQFNLRAFTDINLTLASASGTVSPQAISDTGNIVLNSDNDITLRGDILATAITGTDTTPTGDIFINSAGVLNQNGAAIQGGRIVTLLGGNGNGQIILSDNTFAGWRINLDAADIDLDQAAGLAITTGNGTSAIQPGIRVGGRMNSLDPDPNLAAGLNIDFASRTGLVMSLGDLVGSVRPLAFFSIIGGSLEFRASGASAALPSISVVNPGNFPDSGYLNFGGSNQGTDLVLFQDTYLRSQGDMTFGGNITCGFDRGNAIKAIFDLATVAPLGSTAPNGGQIIFNGGIGTAAAPVGQVVVEARGSRPVDPLDPTSTLKDAQISINGSLYTFPGVNPGNTGGVRLTADGAVVVTSDINTTGGTLAQATDIGGNIIIQADADGDGGDNKNENIQLGGNNPASFLTRGGSVQLNGDVYLVEAANINTTAGNENGSITFGKKFDGVSALTLDAGIAPIFFQGLVGSLTPAGLTVSNSGGITFDQKVIMGGDYSLRAEGTGVVFNQAVDGRQSLSVTSLTGDIQFLSTLGGTTPIASLTIGAGGLRPSNPDRIYFHGDVITQGTTQSGSSFILVSKDAVVAKPLLADQPMVFKTDARATVTGGNITFLGALTPDASASPTGYKLELAAGSGGAVLFNGNVGAFLGETSSPDLAKPQFNTFKIRSASGVGMGDQVVVYAKGESPTTDTINIDAGLSSFFPQGLLTFRAGQGNVVLSRGGDLSGAVAGQGNNTAGSSLAIKVDGTGNISVGSLLNVSGGDNDSASQTNPGGPGYDSGFVYMYTQAGVIDIGSINASGGASTGFGAGGSGRSFQQGVPSKLTALIGNALGVEQFGAINLVANNVVVGGALISNGGAGTTSIGGTGGGVQVRLLGDPKSYNPLIPTPWRATREAFSAGSIYANGGASSGLIGGDGGSVVIQADQGILVAPTTFQLAGGNGANNNLLLAGRGGDVTIRTAGVAGDIFFNSTQFNLAGNGKINIEAGRNLRLEYRKYLVDVDSLGLLTKAPDVLTLGGVTIAMNQGTALPQNNRGQITMKFATATDGDYAYASGATAGFYMPSNAYLLTNGGNVVISGGFEGDTPETSFAGNAVISGISTSGADVSGGNILIANRPTDKLGDVTVGSALETFGGTPVTPTYGRAGGTVTVSGRDLTLRRIDSHGSDSLATAIAPAIGGSGGNIELTAAGTITLRRDLIASGGQGLGVGDATGGAGGNVILNGNVTLLTGEADRPSVAINTVGGLGQGDGETGQGGNIAWLIGNKLQGSEGSSNTLELQYGSGTVTLGANTTQTINLGELITAANDARSSGLLQVGAFMNEITTLTTYARGYNVALLGGGTVATPTTFLNTGYVQLGAADVETGFTMGVNTQQGPVATLLGGTLKTAAAFNDSEPSILLGNVQLIANAELNTFGNTLALGSVDSITSPFDLTLAAGIGNGTIQLPGNFGANAGRPSALGDGSLLVAPGTITIETMPSRVSSLVFAGTVTAEGIQSLSSLPLEFRQDVNLTGETDIAGNVLLNNLAGGSNVIDFNLGDNSMLSGNITLQGGAARLGGFGSWEVGAISGSQDLTIAGSDMVGPPAVPGVVTINGSVSVADLVLEKSAEKVFASTVNAATITQTDDSDTVTFNNLVNSAGAAFFEGAVTLSGAGRFSGRGATTINGGLTLASLTPGAGGILAGGGLYTISSITGPGQTLTYSGSGAVSVGDVNLGSILGSGTGTMNFRGDVISETGSSFRGLVKLGALFATTSGTTSFSAVQLTGATTFEGNLRVSGSLAGNGNNLILADASTRGFFSATGLGSVFIFDGDSTFNAGLSAGDLVQFGGELDLFGTTRLTGAADLGGITTLHGISFSADAVSLGGTINSLGNTLFIGSNGVEVDGTFNSIGNTSITGPVTLGAGGGLNSSSAGRLLKLNSGLVLERDFTMAGDGNYQVSGAITGPARELTFGGLGTKTLSGTIGLESSRLGKLKQNPNSGMVVFGGDVFSGEVKMESATTVSGGAVTIDSGSANQLYTTLNLVRNLTVATTGGTATTTFNGFVSGSGDLTVKGAGSLNIGAGGSLANAGTFRAEKETGILDIGGAYLNKQGFEKIFSAGGAAFVNTGGAVTASSVAAKTGLVLDGSSFVEANTITGSSLSVTAGTGSASVNDVRLSGNLAVSSDSGVANNLIFLGSSSARGLSLKGRSVTGLSGLSVSQINGVSLSGGGLNYQTSGNLTVAGRVATSGGVVLAPSGNFVNAYAGNPFAAPSVKILTQDFFSYPQSAAVPGLTPRYGVTSISRLGDNEIGVTLPLSAGSAGPYITEFTTGTGQPYILATQNAVPRLMFPAMVFNTGALGSKANLTEDEMEMLTPAERSELEARQRQQAARVLWQRSSGQTEEIGLPTEGEIPQAKATGSDQPVPTAQVILQGKPLAGQDAKERRDSTQLLRPRTNRAISQASELNVEKILEEERLAAEVNIGSAPVAGR